MDTLYDRLKAYSESDYYGFHMPGHKRNKKYVNAGLPCAWDITEIEGFDDLHHAEGILKEAQEQAAQVYHAEETAFFSKWKYGGTSECGSWGDRERRYDTCGKKLPPSLSIMQSI